MTRLCDEGGWGPFNLAVSQLCVALTEQGCFSSLWWRGAGWTPESLQVRCVGCRGHR